MAVLCFACSEASLETNEVSDCPPDSAIDWQSFAEPLLLNHCTGCHSSHLPEGARAKAPLGVDFDTHEKTLMWLERIAARSAGENTTMPPIDTLTAQERALLGEWIACGAP